ncbi:hypothetical protein N656DRAFT_514242 [Canariomyces notabilis]|uniref:Uncharacterized protein n=1 Tax=Canariomyces notabilis TaxID=2074819 RepID=A0AAN6QBV5_9PEZI|nr:hypothetical protein N656DRAFT_514242 [Canariomyces arenarius]
MDSLPECSIDFLVDSSSSTSTIITLEFSHLIYARLYERFLRRAKRPFEYTTATRSKKIFITLPTTTEPLPTLIREDGTCIFNNDSDAKKWEESTGLWRTDSLAKIRRYCILLDWITPVSFSEMMGFSSREMMEEAEGLSESA